MSCLSLDELSLSEQAAIVGSFTAACERRYAALQSVSWPSPSTADPTRSVSLGMNPCVPALGDGHTSLTHSEDNSMVEKQVTNHPPIQICYPGHRPMMWQATGNCKVEYYVECSQCGVRGHRSETPDLAATAWARRFVEPIVGTVDHTAAAAA